MHQSKLIDLLKTFSPHELKRLEDFLHSPIHNQSVRCQQLFAAIKPYFGDFGHLGLEKENIFAQLFPQKKKFDNSLSVLMAQLTKLIQDFLIFLKFEEEKEQQDYWLLSSLLERELNKYFLRTWKIAEKKQRNLLGKKANHYYSKYLLTLSKYQYNIGYEKKLSKINIDEILHDLNLFYLIEQLKYYNALINLQRVVPQNTISPIPIENLNQTIRDQKWHKIPIVMLYHTTLLLTLFPEDSNHFFRLKDFLQSSNINQISFTDLQDAYRLASNYCTQQIVKGQESYRREMFDLYQSMIEQELWYNGQGYVSHRKLKNIISLGARFGEFDWSKNLLEQYLQYILPDYQFITKVFNLGAIYYYQRKFGNAMPYLLQVNNLDTFYAIDARTLLLKIYYELEETIELMDLERSFKAFVKSQKELSADRKKAYIHFAKFLVVLYRIQHKQLKSRKTLEVLKRDIEATSTISDKQWLEDKIALLEG